MAAGSSSTHNEVPTAAVSPSPPSPNPPTASGASQHNELQGLSTMALFKRANYTKVMILLKAVFASLSSCSLSLLFLWRDYGLIDLLCFYTKYSRYILTLILGRSIPWTMFVVLSSTSLLPKSEQGFSSIKVKRIINTNMVSALLSAFFMCIAGEFLLREVWTSNDGRTDPAAIDTSNGTAITSVNTTQGGDNAAIEWNWDNFQMTRKALVLTAYAFCDYLATVTSNIVFHHKPSVKVLLRQMQTNTLLNGVTWLWFSTIVAVCSFSANPYYSAIFKGIMLGGIFPALKVVVVFFSIRAAESLNRATKADDNTARKCISEWVAGAEVAMNLASMYGIFLSSSNYLFFLSQFVPQEVIEQLTAFLSHHPWIIKQRIVIKHAVKERILSGENNTRIQTAEKTKSPANVNRVAPSEAVVSPQKDDIREMMRSQSIDGERKKADDDRTQRNNILDERSTVTRNLEKTLKHVGVEVAAREFGEDGSFFMAALFSLPFAQETWCYTIASTTTANDTGTLTLPTTVDVLVCLFCFSLSIEHTLSVMGIMAIEKKGVEVTHDHGKLSLRVVSAVVYFMMLLAAGEA
jgi:hypothetical protein